MDPRVEEHARLVVEHSIGVEEGDEVLLSGDELAEDLIVALHEQIGENGGFPIVWGQRSRAHRAYVRALDPERYDEVPDTLAAIVENIDASVGVRGTGNTYETSDVPPEKTTAFESLLKPFREKMMEKRWVSTQYPAPGNAQDAEMSTAEYEDFVWGAVNKDWEAQREFQEPVVEKLDAGSDVRVVSGETTDVRMSIDGTVAKNDHGELNLPGGEVYVAPVPDSVEGRVLFDMPLIAFGREVRDASVVFENGDVVEYDAAKNEDVLDAVLDTDEGARRLGELGIGMNRDIDRFTYNMLFDEKMGDTVHLALGRAPDGLVPDESPVERNDSAIHLDMIVDMSDDSSITVDGELIQDNGTFWFEEDFEAAE